MRRLIGWVFGKTSDDVAPEFAGVEDEAVVADSPYRAQIKRDLVHDTYSWRIINRNTGYEPRPSRSVGLLHGTAYTKGGAKKAARKRIEKLLAQEKNNEQQWEDV